MELVKGKTAPEVWLLGAEHLAKQKSRQDFDVFLNLATPTVLSREDVAVLKRVDTFLSNHGGLPVNCVAETIFPLEDYLRGGAEEVFEVYPRRMAEIHHSRTDRRWGCYALRILRQRDHKGRVFNPLANLLEKIRNHGNYKACHELSTGRPFEEDVPIYDGALDRKPTYGNLPCLSHISEPLAKPLFPGIKTESDGARIRIGARTPFYFASSSSIKVDDGAIRLNATYRSHYYVQRLLGNLIGLGRLQFFLAHESGLDVGPLTINSTYARLDKGSDNGSGCNWGFREIGELLSACRSVYSERVAA